MLTSKIERVKDVFGLKNELYGAQFIGTNNTCYYFEKDGVLMKWNETIGLELNVIRKERYVDVPPRKEHILLFTDELDMLKFDSLTLTQYGMFDVFDTPKELVFKDIHVCFMIPVYDRNKLCCLNKTISYFIMLEKYSMWR
jgi:hypothetical protein